MSAVPSQGASGLRGTPPANSATGTFADGNDGGSPFSQRNGPQADPQQEGKRRHLVAQHGVQIARSEPRGLQKDHVRDARPARPLLPEDAWPVARWRTGRLAEETHGRGISGYAQRRCGGHASTARRRRPYATPQCQTPQEPPSRITTQPPRSPADSAASLIRMAP